MDIKRIIGLSLLAVTLLFGYSAMTAPVVLADGCDEDGGDADNDGTCDNWDSCTDPNGCDESCTDSNSNGTCDDQENPCDVNPESCYVYGCTDPSATNYNSSANQSDGSCEYPTYGCTDSAASNYNSSATQDDGSCSYTVYGCTDGAANNYNSSATQDDGSCSYTTYGCTDSSANNYNSSATQDDGSCDYDSYGCTDSSASNYDAAATQDDGSCQYGVYGCTDSNANNYDATATDDDGSCTYDVYGCMDPTAANFDPTATVDDGSCQFDGSYGCTNPEAANFDPLAVNDDGSCIIYGCTDPEAYSYDAEATDDDGSCVMESVCVLTADFTVRDNGGYEYVGSTTLTVYNVTPEPYSTWCGYPEGSIDYFEQVALETVYPTMPTYVMNGPVLVSISSIDACYNLPGIQSEMPENHIRDADKKCIDQSEDNQECINMGGIVKDDGTCQLAGVCGDAHGSTSGGEPNTGLCDSGTASGVIDLGDWYSWYCTGDNDGAVACCYAEKTCGVDQKTCVDGDGAVTCLDDLTGPDSCCPGTQWWCSVEDECLAINAQCDDVNRCPAENPYACPDGRTCAPDADSCEVIVSGDLIESMVLDPEFVAAPGSDGPSQCVLSWTTTSVTVGETTTYAECELDGDAVGPSGSGLDVDVGKHTLVCTLGETTATAEATCKQNPLFEEF
jgi:hypothetical protein